MQTKQKYGLSTCIAMIVGVVIGSGIFFKSDNVLIATNGNIFLGCLAFLIAAISIIFGSLTIAELAKRTDKPGGIITYTEDAYGSHAGCAFGWFQLFLYYPTTLCVLTGIIGMYMCMLFGITTSLFIQMIIGLGVVALLALMNILSKRVSGYFQSAATIIKLIPLVLIGVCGFIFGEPSTTVVPSLSEFKSGNWLTALIPIVFAFDGWVVSTSMTQEIKNAKRNLPLALIFAPLAILAMYLLYFVGISIYVGPENIMALGDSHVELAAINLLGPWGAKAIIIFIIVSVAGTCNGFLSGIFQLPYALAIRNMLPYSKQIAKVNQKYDTSLVSCSIGILVTLFWVMIHYVSQTYHLLPNSDVSEISITLNYVLLIGLYYEVFRLSYRGEIKSFFKGKVNPILAMIGSFIILYVGLQNKLFIYYVIICLVLLVSGYLYSKKVSFKETSVESLEKAA